MNASILRPSLTRFAVISTLSLSLAACGSGGAPQDAGAGQGSVPVEVAAATHAPINASYSGTAALDAEHEADVVAKASGVLLKLYVEEGQHVQAGQLLAQIDPASASNTLAQSAAQLRKAQTTYDRAAKAIQKQLIPKAEYDQDLYDMQAQAAATQGAQLQLSWTRITAPIAGVISKRMVKQGNLVQTNQAIFHIVDMNPLTATLNVPEREIGTLKSGQPVKLAVDALPGKNFVGSIQRIAPVVDAASGTFRVTCVFDNAAAGNEVLRPGMFGRIDIVYDQRRDALVIPRSALMDEDGETAVFVVEPGKAKPKPVVKTRPRPGDAVAAEPRKILASTLVATRRTVKIGYVDGDRVEIRGGLKAGERVITLGRDAVRDGSEVQVLAPTTADAKAAASAASAE
ncbi:MAG TPA: efflux RND transporter periplasmic adaptor subunit [Rhodanobacteraceae bacterium]|nr:efflux RND transporter periplasmic adaptor subunit [Rhodanobacteraceae bacterium]